MASVTDTNQADREEFAKWLEYQMRSRGWKQADLAHHSRISPGQISNLLLAKRGIGAVQAQKLAKALNLDVESVFGAAGIIAARTAQADDVWTEQIVGLVYRIVWSEDRAEIILAQLRKMREHDLREVLEKADALADRL